VAPFTPRASEQLDKRPGDALLVRTPFFPPLCHFRMRGEWGAVSVWSGGRRDKRPETQNNRPETILTGKLREFNLEQQGRAPTRGPYRSGRRPCPLYTVPQIIKRS
jgi:hypothetical protein